MNKIKALQGKHGNARGLQEASYGEIVEQGRGKGLPPFKQKGRYVGGDKEPSSTCKGPSIVPLYASIASTSWEAG